jgi:hypothetical protein
MARMTERVMVSDPVKARIVRLTAELSKVKGRDVTYSDTIEELLNHLDDTSRLLDDIAAGKS